MDSTVAYKNDENCEWPWNRPQKHFRNRSKWPSRQEKKGPADRREWRPGRKADVGTDFKADAEKPVGASLNNHTAALNMAAKSSGWDATPLDGPDPWALPAETVIPAPQDEWVVEDPNAPLRLTSLNLATYCNSVDDFFVKAKSSQEYHANEKRKKITAWVMSGTEEEKVPNLKGKGVRKSWEPFRVRTYPGAYS
ncbi:hypothetical protein BDZ91DRAFT_781431 [Kalaharituber pfeilii]|nr:hypothetical protein BDZ91DRAFT_781431 [Kalaharituber pfeilii]